MPDGGFTSKPGPLSQVLPSLRCLKLEGFPFFWNFSWFRFIVA